MDIDLQHGAGIVEADPAIPSAAQMGQWIEAVLQRQDRSGETVVTVRVVDAPEMADLNQTYRHKTGVTNILSFPFSAPPGLVLPLLGDMVVCLPVLQQEAAAQGKPLQQHWAHLLVHGTLHLLGFDHVDPLQAVDMEGLECEILQSFGIPDPYGEIDK